MSSRAAVDSAAPIRGRTKSTKLFLRSSYEGAVARPFPHLSPLLFYAAAWGVPARRGHDRRTHKRPSRINGGAGPQRETRAL